jgi:glycosyltransferase involved in cell wall biosynthesis
VVNISTDCSDIFRPISIPAEKRESLLRRLRIERPFILVSGTIDPHKNLDRFFHSFARLPEALRDQYSIVLIGNPIEEHRSILRQTAKAAAIADETLVLTGHISDEDLVALYNLCTVMVFPSYDEGFGLPILEAMACGAVAIGANATSIPEVVGRRDALFDPHDEMSIADKLERALTDNDFREDLQNYGPTQAARFSWDETAKIAIRAMEKLVSQKRSSKTHYALRRNNRTIYRAFGGI